MTRAHVLSEVKVPALSLTLAVLALAAGARSLAAHVPMVRVRLPRCGASVRDAHPVDDAAVPCSACFALPVNPRGARR